jgi:hypothetical protein
MPSFSSMRDLGVVRDMCPRSTRAISAERFHELRKSPIYRGFSNEVVPDMSVSLSPILSEFNAKNCFSGRTMVIVRCKPSSSDIPTTVVPSRET